MEIPARLEHRIAGHYGRPDPFEVTVHRNARAMVHGGAALVDGRTTPVDATDDGGEDPPSHRA